ncbi:putative membrane protein [Erysipelothrix amsterdamensis]|uniref:Membrane protein n=1 Tax=Erysipelothrix amsterdamensis TaxID=2929157 RepID=A0AAU9VJD1_9FIRM|nr:putative membrane protein [Erysipelothrix sp. A18Y020d]CAH2762551.1 putative membrane protein [Erysipelothrix sp. A18Y020d]
MFNSREVVYTVVSIMCLIFIMITLLLIIYESKECWNKKLQRYTNSIYLLIFPVILYTEKPATDIVVLAYLIIYICFLIIRKKILQRETL